MVDPISDDYEIATADSMKKRIMDVTRDEDIVAPFVTHVAGHRGQEIRGFFLSAPLAFLAFARDLSGDAGQQIGMEESGRLDHGGIAEDRPQDTIAPVMGEEKIAVGAPDLPTLSLDEEIIVVDAHAEVAAEKVSDPAVMVTAEKMQLDPTQAAAVQCKENVEIAVRNDRFVFKIEIEDVSQQQKSGSVGYAPQKANETVAAFSLARKPAGAKVAV